MLFALREQILKCILEKVDGEVQENIYEQGNPHMKALRFLKVRCEAENMHQGS